MSDQEHNTVRQRGFGFYLKRFFLLALPVLNLAVAMVWAFGGRDEEERAFGKAALVVQLVVALVVVAGALLSYAALLNALAEYRLP